jgi:hypothetical protein
MFHSVDIFLQQARHEKSSEMVRLYATLYPENISSLICNMTHNRLENGSGARVVLYTHPIHSHIYTIRERKET